MPRPTKKKDDKNKIEAAPKQSHKPVNNDVVTVSPRKLRVRTKKQTETLYESPAKEKKTTKTKKKPPKTIKASKSKVKFTQKASAIEKEESIHSKEVDPPKIEKPAKSQGTSKKRNAPKEVKPESSEDEATPPKKAKSSRSRVVKPVKPEAEAPEIEEMGLSKSKTSKKTETQASTKKGKANKASNDFSKIDYNCDKLNAEGQQFNFKISCWNVGGLRAWLGKGCLEYLEHEKPDIFCMQEVKCSDEKLPVEIKQYQGYFTYWFCAEKDGYAGVGLMSKRMPIEVYNGIGDKTHDGEGRIITAEYKNYYVCCVYVPNSGRGLVTLNKRLDWNKKFDDYIDSLNKRKPVIICGDMNVAHKEIDLKNPKTNKKTAGFTVEERDGMTDLLARGYVDIYRSLYPDKELMYTFWTYMSNARAKNVGWRVDYFIVSERLVPKVCDNVIRTNIFGSDHCPLVLYLNI